jgi:hypothetical protein
MQPQMLYLNFHWEKITRRHSTRLMDGWTVGGAKTSMQPGLWCPMTMERPSTLLTSSYVRTSLVAKKKIIYFPTDLTGSGLMVQTELTSRRAKTTKTSPYAQRS